VDGQGDTSTTELRPWVARLMDWNNARVRTVDDGHPNPRPVESERWHRRLIEDHPTIRAEWDEFARAGGDIPLIEETLGRPDQNEGSYWKMVPFITRARPVPTLERFFPATTTAFLRIPALQAACWSVLGPGGHIPEHVGLNAGCLRLLVPVDAEMAAITVGGHQTRFRDGHGVLFEDIVPHEVRNEGDVPRVVVLCDLIRPVKGVARVHNRVTQWAQFSLTPGYRDCALRGAEHFARRNADLVATRDGS